MKIVAFSDTHNKHKKIKDFQTEWSQGESKIPLGGDVAIHAGDATGRGEKGEILPFLNWFASLEFTHKILVPGNHDWGFQRDPDFYRKECEDRGIILLINQSVEIEGIKFYGSPATPWFYSWAFNYRRFKDQADQFGDIWIKDIWDMIPTDTNVLITHGPPKGILDELPNGELVGCDELLSAVKRIKPSLHIFGHIHCGYGEKHVDGTSFYNASICSEMYTADNQPHVIYL